MRIAKGQNQDGRWGARRVQVSPQLGHLLDTGGEPRYPGGWEEPPEAWYKVEGVSRKKQQRMVETSPPEGDWEKGCHARRGTITLRRIRGIGKRVPSGVWRIRGEYAGHSPHPLNT